MLTAVAGIVSAFVGAGTGVAWGRSVERRLGAQKAALDANIAEHCDMERDLEKETRARKETETLLRADVTNAEARMNGALINMESRTTAAYKALDARISDNLTVLFSKNDKLADKIDKLSTSIAEMRGEIKEARKPGA
mgnify:CR=1 FL=1